MAKKQSAQFVCTNCGAVRAAWAGRCDNCGEWNTLQEEALVVTSGGGSLSSKKQLEVISAKNVVKSDSAKRILVGISDVDIVLGGGLVPGSVSLIAGQPGIGKSTLLLQVAVALCASVKVLYISGEESVHQIGLRAQRLHATHESLQLASGTNAEDIAATIVSGKYDVVIVDSIQTVTVSGVASMAGTVSQITNSTHLLMGAAKQTNTAVILVGHVTKEGSIAGPKVLEHVVDVVLQLEGDRYGGFKILRSVKNRFGSTNEAGIFEMQENGLEQVKNPSAALLAERQVTDGSVVLATMEGSRPILVEVQALVNKTSYGYPKRTASGMDLTRLNLLVAMLERRTKLQLSDQDIYINIVGGIRLNEPAADLAICMAIGSAAKGLKLKGNAVVFGEVGLSGEVRHVPFAEKRLQEAEKLGFDLVIGPKTKLSKKSTILQSVPDVRTALNTYLEV
jgi:DNA repair protein RadA/Sms